METRTSRGRHKKSDLTRQRILDAARRLFNDRGTAAVSTNHLAAGMALAYRYRFFEREVLALLRADPKLRAAYQEVYQRRLGQWVAFGEHLVAQGVLRPPRPPRTLRDLVVAIWLIAGSWIAFLDVTGDPGDQRQV